MNNSPRQQSRAPTWIWLGYVAFVVYGSLVPLEFKSRPLAAAWVAFQQIPFLKLGIESRADWIANGVLYVPVGVFSVMMLRTLMPRLPQSIALPFAAIFCAALAVGVEFTQLFFPPRTVSLNDLIAEVLGSFLGLVLGSKFSDWFTAFFGSILHDTRRLTVLALDAYIVAYLAFALFPFDFLLSANEISDKWDSRNWGWLLAGGNARFGIVVVKLVAEVVLTLPFGWLLMRSLRRRGLYGRQGEQALGHRPAGRRTPVSARDRQPARYGLALLVGFSLGLFLEVTQFFIASGTSQGLSVATRMLGVCIGVWLGRLASGWMPDDVARWMRRIWPALVFPYLLALLEINGWLTTRWQDIPYALEQLAKVNFMPFYYHYFTTEAVALFSLAAVFMSYLPMGLLAWAFRRGAWFSVIFAALTASFIETGKLFIKGMHPDPTNMFIACAASCIALAVMRLLSNPKTTNLSGGFGPVSSGHVRHTAPNPLPHDPAKQYSRLTLSQLSVAQWGVILAGIGSVATWVSAFSGLPLLVALVLVGVWIAVWRKPVLVFGVLPAALPVFDLAPWSGRFFLDEFDVLVLSSMAVAFIRLPRPVATGLIKAQGPRGRRRTPADSLLYGASALLTLAIAISAVLGLMPLQWPDANAFNNYFSPYNALRIIKGAVFGCLFWRLANRFSDVGSAVSMPFAWGMVGGLAMTVLVVIWERLAFPGLLDFSSDYRATGPISAMHIGGAYIECFIAAATPFLIFLMIREKHWIARVGGMLLLLATTYALMVTFSRNGYSAFAVGIVLALLPNALQARRTIGNGLFSAGILGAMLVMALPIYKGDFAQARMATVGADIQVRERHWEDALSLRDTGWGTALFGMGIGRYPSTNLWRGSQLPVSGTYQLENESDNTFLRLSSGSPIYMKQWVQLKPGQNYLLKFDVRPKVAGASLSVPICEEWMLTSYSCVTQTFEFGGSYGKWRTVEKRFSAAELSADQGNIRRPFKLALYYPTPKSSIDVDNISLVSDNGVNLIGNGDFAVGLDRWFFSADSHLQWHVKSLFYGVLFDQGWFGLMALCLFLMLALYRAVQKCLQGDPTAVAPLAALSSFLVAGLFDTLIDAPRFFMLLLLLAWACSRGGRPLRQVPSRQKPTNEKKFSLPGS